MLHRKTTFTLLALMAWLCLANHERYAESSPVPNIVIVLTDDQGYGDIGVHDNSRIHTPHLDRFAREGIELTRFYCNPVCSPTRASLLTGRYYYRTGVLHTSLGGAKMHSDEVTLAEYLRAAGYKTGIFGKWHLGDNYPMRPQDQGFDEVLVHTSGGINQPPDVPNSYFDPRLWHNGRPVQPQGYCTDIFFQAAMEFIEQHRAAPFLVYLPTNAPHTPLEIGRQYTDPYKAQKLDDTTAGIYGMVTNIDDNFGRLLTLLEKLKLRDNTMILFLSDNGPQQRRYNAGLRSLKTSCYEGGLRVPFFLQWPARFEGSRKIPQIAAHIDLVPTLLELCNAKPKEMAPALDGSSLVPLLEGKKESWPDRRLYFQCHQGLDPKRYQSCAVVTDRYKLVGYSSTFINENLDTTRGPLWELYDLEKDPGERTNLANSMKSVVEPLQAGYEAWFDDVRRTRNFEPGVIHIGNEAEDPVRLCRSQDATFRNQQSLGWNVTVEKTGRYRIAIKRDKAAAVSAITVRWLDKEFSQPVQANEDSAVFNLRQGHGLIDVWLTENGQRRPAVKQWESTRDDVLVQQF